MSPVSQRVLSLALALLIVPALAQSIVPVAVPPPSIAAKAWLLVDVLSGQTLVAENADAPRAPASLTKLMTAYVAFRALNDKEVSPSQMVTVSEKAWRAEGSRMFIEPKKAVTVDELLHGVIVQSGNDASIALAETIAGSEDAFVERMNREAARLGMKNTHFVNATGLPAPGETSTANDLALLAEALIRDFPQHYALYSIKEYRYNNITQPNRNRLLWTDPYVDGIKTGNTDAAGYCLIASAKRGQRRLLSVVLGASSESARAIEAQRLLNYGFQFYDSVQLYQSGQAVSSLRVWKGAAREVPAGFVVDRYVTLPKGQAQNLKLSLEAVEPLLAPVAKGQRVGTVKVTLDGKPVGAYPLVALSDVAPASVLGRAWDSVRLWFR
ncbi:MAG TPA: D-alanyl-D-alanine carboxypeptidase family protein [Casimicrobiaceae bacterium]|nr:D-alanyl-D-alanine carboxypeptidase family protein [Casimicrobiaceae bacterium]